MTNAPDPDPDDEFADDPDEAENEKLESAGMQWVLWPLYIVLFLIWVGLATVPIVIFYTLGWMAFSLKE